MTTPIIMSPTTKPRAATETGVSLNITLTSQQAESTFLGLFDKLCEQANNCSIAQGGWQNNPATGDKISAIHFEVSQALQALKTGNKASDAVVGFSQAEVEFADVLISVMDYTRQSGFRLGDALIARLKYYAMLPPKA